MAWTAQAADAQRQQAETEREKVLAEVQIPPARHDHGRATSQWKTEVAYWPTMQAQQTQAVYDQRLADRQLVGQVMNGLTGTLIPVLLASLMLAAFVSAIVMPAALS